MEKELIECENCSQWDDESIFPEEEWEENEWHCPECQYRGGYLQ